MTRPERGRRWPAQLAAAALCVLFGAACAPPAGPTLQLPTETVAVEVRIGSPDGGGFCRRLEDPAALDDLLAFAAAHSTGWEASWNEQEAPPLVFRFLDETGGGPSLGIGEGQLHATFEGRSYFQPLSEAERRDLLERLGGPPTGAPEIACRAEGNATTPAEPEA